MSNANIYYYTRSVETIEKEGRVRRRRNTINVGFIPNPCPACGSFNQFFLQGDAIVRGERISTGNRGVPRDGL
jgi:hypothetical protein